MSRIRVGAAFVDWESFDGALKQYSSDNFVRFVKHNTKTVDSANKQRSVRLPDRLRYSFAKFVCYNYGDKHIQKNRQTDGSRPNQR